MHIYSAACVWWETAAATFCGPIVLHVDDDEGRRPRQVASEARGRRRAEPTRVPEVPGEQQAQTFSFRPQQELPKRCSGIPRRVCCVG